MNVFAIRDLPGTIGCWYVHQRYQGRGRFVSLWTATVAVLYLSPLWWVAWVVQGIGEGVYFIAWVAGVLRAAARRDLGRLLALGRRRG